MDVVGVMVVMSKRSAIQESSRPFPLAAAVVGEVEVSRALRGSSQPSGGQGKLRAESSGC